MQWPALASGLVSAGVAASATTTADPAATTTANASTVSMPTVDVKVQRETELNDENSAERRVEFRFLGTSL
jgi:ApbE superfamily uncharacterized protein (UPF0280 family)